MTLIVYAKCRDGHIIALDRKENSLYGAPSESEKYYFNENAQFLLALGQDGWYAKSLFGLLSRDDSINNSNIKQKIAEKVRTIYAQDQQRFLLLGFLLVKEGEDIKLYNVKIENDNCDLQLTDTLFSMVGDNRAQVLTNHLLRNVQIHELPCEMAAKHISAIIRDIADSVETVGKVERFGIDVFAFTNTCTFLTKKRYSDANEKISLNFELKEEVQFFDSEVQQ